MSNASDDFAWVDDFGLEIDLTKRDVTISRGPRGPVLVYKDPFEDYNGSLDNPIQAARKPFRGFLGVYIVRGVSVGKRGRAIRVIIRPFHGVIQEVSDYTLVKMAAEYAAKKGWKTVVVDPDWLYGEYAEVMNWTMYGQRLNSPRGVHTLCYVGRSKMSNKF